MAQASEFVRFVNEQLKERRPVAVHCQAGFGQNRHDAGNLFDRLPEQQCGRQPSAQFARWKVRRLKRRLQVQFLYEFADLVRGQ